MYSARLSVNTLYARFLYARMCTYAFYLGSYISFISIVFERGFSVIYYAWFCTKLILIHVISLLSYTDNHSELTKSETNSPIRSVNMTVWVVVLAICLNVTCAVRVYWCLLFVSMLNEIVTVVRP